MPNNVQTVSVICKSSFSGHVVKHMIEKDSSQLSRREYLATAALTSAALAGCTGTGTDPDMDGEQVEPLILEYVSDLPGLTEMSEGMVPAIEEAAESIGVELEIEPRSSSVQWDNMYSDTRSHHLAIFNYANNPDRLDPDEFVSSASADMAGANGLGNHSNYANCEYTELVRAQARATSQQERVEIINEAFGILSEDIPVIPVITNVQYGAYLPDQVDTGPIGPAGIDNSATRTLIETSALDGGEVRANLSPSAVESNVHMRFTGPTPIMPWSNYIYSPLYAYDENYELMNVLAEDAETSEDGLSVEVTLTDATFHDGEPVTSEDVQWTFEYLDDNRGVFPRAPDVPYDSIETPDDQTVVFNLEEPYVPLIPRVFPQWGILPKDHFIDEGAEDDPSNFTLDEIVGSGPFEVNTFSQGSQLLLDPFDDHPVFSPDSNLNLIAFDDSQSAYTALRNEEINYLQTVDAGIANEIREQVDNAELVTVETPSGLVIWAQYPFGPTKHRPIRHAISQAIDRERISQTVALGEAEPILHATHLSPSHPFWPGEENLNQVADTERANPETAREILEDAGYEWDDNDNLYYPEGADLEPRWPEGEEPSPEEFSCLE